MFELLALYFNCIIYTFYIYSSHDLRHFMPSQPTLWNPKRCTSNATPVTFENYADRQKHYAGMKRLCDGVGCKESYLIYIMYGHTRSCLSKVCHVQHTRHVSDSRLVLLAGGCPFEAVGCWRSIHSRGDSYSMEKCSSVQIKECKECPFCCLPKGRKKLGTATWIKTYISHTDCSHELWPINPPHIMCWSIGCIGWPN